ncbi:hypothetical protein TNCT_677731 [Trichonephila clavata]|uniref:Uncharacterized protein n=1 Tax=Trichonephila clavata TaxID=2740835 RepID=A0A8X6FJU4_TRICU|nr:hypothetical protein TNCT_677731 [Trichonephila clavata]
MITLRWITRKEVLSTQVQNSTQEKARRGVSSDKQKDPTAYAAERTPPDRGSLHLCFASGQVAKRIYPRTPSLEAVSRDSTGSL